MALIVVSFIYELWVRSGLINVCQRAAGMVVIGNSGIAAVTAMPAPRYRPWPPLALTMGGGG
jgi:hypothetical protein